MSLWKSEGLRSLDVVFACSLPVSDTVNVVQYKGHSIKVKVATNHDGSLREVTAVCKDAPGPSITEWSVDALEPQTWLQGVAQRYGLYEPATRTTADHIESIVNQVKGRIDGRYFAIQKVELRGGGDAR